MVNSKVPNSCAPQLRVTPEYDANSKIQIKCFLLDPIYGTNGRREEMIFTHH
jgi:hypothetical protein